MSVLIEFEKKYEELACLLETLGDDIAKVYCIGRQNAGKSTLLDALVDDYEKETFPVSDIRETAKIKQFEYDSVMYVDTPGIGHNDEDDELVYENIKNSDINLFVHIADSGELIKSEIDFLEKIKKNWQDEDFINKTIFVLSQKEKLNQKDLESLKKKISSQIENIFEQTPKIIEVSSNFYILGKQKNQDKVVESSNFKELRSYIEDLKSSIEENKIWRFLEKQKDILNLIDSSIIKNKSTISKIEDEIKNKKSQIDKDISDAESTIKNILKRLED